MNRFQKFHARMTQQRRLHFWQSAWREEDALYAAARGAVKSGAHAFPHSARQAQWRLDIDDDQGDAFGVDFDTPRE